MSTQRTLRTVLGTACLALAGFSWLPLAALDRGRPAGQERGADPNPPAQAPAGGEPQSPPAPAAPPRPPEFAPSWATRPFLAEEIGYLDVAPGARFRLAARFQSLLGTSVTVAGWNESLWLSPSGDFATLRKPAARNRILLFTVVAFTDARGTAALECQSVEPGPDEGALYASLRQALPALGRAQRAAVCSWGAALAGSEGASARDDLLVVQEEILDRELAGHDTADDRLLAWIARGEAGLHADERWQALLLRCAEVHGGRTEIARALSEAGYSRDHTGWRLKGEILAELGMVARGKVALTRERARLEDAIDAWRASGRSDARLLRSLTASHYEKHAKQNGVKEGMLRPEVLLAWGYPTGVTWRRDGEIYFEGWSYEGHFVCLADGHVFQVQ